jgi:hypothetical protein
MIYSRKVKVRTKQTAEMPEDPGMEGREELEGINNKSGRG